MRKIKIDLNKQLMAQRLFFGAYGFYAAILFTKQKLTFHYAEDFYN